jgi:streptomycin 6-kinase
MSVAEDEWRASVAELVDHYVAEWDLRLGEPYTGGSASYVAPVLTSDGDDAVLKLSWPHREARGEATALRWWDGNGAVRLFAHEPEDYALLIERCDPGTPLTQVDLPPDQRLSIATELLAEVWQRGRPEPADSDLERLCDVTAEWADLVEERMERLAPPYDPDLVAQGVDLLRTLPASATREVMVHGDFNPGNVLSSTRLPWLIIDPKPMIGDPGYDLCPLLMQIDDPFTHPDPVPILLDRVDLVAAKVDVPAGRLLSWFLARMVEGALWYADRAEIAPGAEDLAKAAVIADLITGSRRRGFVP